MGDDVPRSWCFRQLSATIGSLLAVNVCEYVRVFFSDGGGGSKDVLYYGFCRRRKSGVCDKGDGRIRCERAFYENVVPKRGGGRLYAAVNAPV